jgi:hypothetical protein
MDGQGLAHWSAYTSAYWDLADLCLWRGLNAVRAHSSGIFAFSNLFFIHVPVSSPVHCLKITFVIAPHFANNSNHHSQNGAPSHVTR